jgi:fatty acid synthase
VFHQPGSKIVCIFNGHPLPVNFSGTEIGDVIECKTIVDTFCVNRKKPLLVGSTKSNIGHIEPVSGLCSIMKSIFALETGIIAPNVNFTKLKASIEALGSGVLQVVTELQELEGSFIGINSFDIGGTNGM